MRAGTFRQRGGETDSGLIMAQRAPNKIAAPRYTLIQILLCSILFRGGGLMKTLAACAWGGLAFARLLRPAGGAKFSRLIADLWMGRNRDAIHYKQDADREGRVGGAMSEINKLRIYPLPKPAAERWRLPYNAEVPPPTPRTRVLRMAERCTANAPQVSAEACWAIRSAWWSANRLTPAKIDSGSRWASSITSFSSPPVSH